MTLMQLSIVDLMAASTITVLFATLNAISVDWISGFRTESQGFPFIALTQDPVTGTVVHWPGAIANTFLCIGAVVGAAVLLSRIRRNQLSGRIDSTGNPR
jgi:hypothetical protein